MNIIFNLTREGKYVGFAETTEDGGHIIVPDYARSGDVFVPEGTGFSIFRGRTNKMFSIEIDEKDYSWQFLSLLRGNRLSPLNKAILLLGAFDNRSYENKRKLQEIIDACMGEDFQGINLTCKIS